MSGMSDWRFGYGTQDPNEEPVTREYFESFLKDKEKQDQKTAAEESARKQKTIQELFRGYKQQIYAGSLDPLSASKAFKEEAQGYGGPAKRTRLATQLGELRPIPGYNPRDYARRQNVLEEKRDILAQPKTWEEKIAQLTNRTGSIQDKIAALKGSEDYDLTPNTQAEKDVLARLSSLEEKAASIDPAKDAARVAKLEGKLERFDPEKATADLDARLAELDPNLRYQKTTGQALSTTANILGLPKGTVSPKLEKSLYQQAKAEGIGASELPSWMRTKLESSPTTRPYLLLAPQEERQFDYGNIGRDESGKISNTYQSVLTGNRGIASSYGLKPGQGMSISDIEHLKGIDMQNVVNAGLTKVENIRATSNLMNLIGYALS